MFNHRLVDICKTFYSIAIINIIVTLSKLRKKKIIFFYHPRKNLTLNHVHYLKDLFSYFYKDYTVLHGHEVKNYKRKHFFYVSQSFLIRWLFNIDIFFSLNVCEKFPDKSINIYMHHDISTAPLVEKKKEKQLYERLIRYNYIFSSDQKSKKMFSNLFMKYNKDNIKKIPKIFCVGYYKLDHLIKKYKKLKVSNNQIVIAPSDYRHIKKLTILNNLNQIIKKLLLKTSYKIIFRPYPVNRDSKLVKNIKKKFEKEKKFSLDFSDDYFNIYSKSLCLITDISGTAYTYAFMTNRPIIFFSKKESILKKFGYSDLDYFKDRKKVGYIANNANDVVKYIKRFENGYNNIKKTNRNLLYKFEYLGKSKKRIKNVIDKIVTKNF
tara:strand:+ start:130 stop:1266 length:1137 start_codon:yes stop_codon:yes gene_type:complete